MTTTQTIDGFAKLEPGWNFGDGRVPSRAVIERARELNLALCSAGLDHTSAFPGIDGEIMVCAYSGDFTFEFEVEWDTKSISLVIEHKCTYPEDIFIRSWEWCIRAETIVRTFVIPSTWLRTTED